MSQAIILLNLLSDGLPHRTDEVLEVVYGGSHLGIARIGARIHDLKRMGYEISGWKDKEQTTLYWYQLSPVKNPIHHGLSDPPPQKETKTQGSFSNKELFVLNSTPWD